MYRRLGVLTPSPAHVTNPIKPTTATHPPLVLSHLLGHVIFKKIQLEVSWQLVQYLFKIGATEDEKRSYLFHAPMLVYMTMAGRMMQVGTLTDG